MPDSRFALSVLQCLALVACEARRIGTLECVSDDDCGGGQTCNDGVCLTPELPLIDDADRVNYTFDGSMQGWVFNDYDDPMNIHVHVPEGAAAPTLELSATEGDPEPGALVVNMPFTTPDQSLDVTVYPTPIDLSQQRLRARLKLLSGSAPYLQIYAISAPGYRYHGAIFGQTSFELGQWVLLELNPLTSPDAAYRPDQILQLGILFISVDPSAGPVRMALDTVESVATLVPLPGGPDSINYSFEGGLQGWLLAYDEDPVLVARPAEDIASATIETRTEEGDPNSSVMVLSARFTARGQYVAATAYPQRGDLSGKTLRARVRRAAGSIASFELVAKSGEAFVHASERYLENALPLGEWVTLEMDLDAQTEPGFDPSAVGQLGVAFDSIASSDDLVVIEIDSVTDG